MRWATGAPPPPPPMIRTRSTTGLPSLLDDDLVVSVLRVDRDEPMAGLGDPQRNVGRRAAVGRPDGDDVADLALADAPDELHEGSRAKAAPRIDRSGDGRRVGGRKNRCCHRSCSVR